MHAPLLTISGPPGCGKSTALVREALRAIDEDGLAPQSIYLLAIAPAQKTTLRAMLQRESAHRRDEAWRQVSVWTMAQFCQAIGHHAARQRTDAAASGLLRGILPPQEARWRLYAQAHAMAAQLALPGQAWLRAPLRQPAMAKALQRLQQALDGLPISMEARAEWLRAIRDDALQGPEKLPEILDDPFVPLCTLLASDYQQRAAEGRLTFHEWLLACERWLREDAPTREAVARQMRLLLIDEAQELGPLHWALLRALPDSTRLALAGTSGLCLRQSQGAWPQAFADPCLALGASTPLTRMPPPGETLCWRDNTALLHWADTWLAQVDDTHRPLAPEWAVNHDETAHALSQAVCFGVFASVEREAQAVAEVIATRHRASGTPWGETMIVLRRRHDDDPLCAALRAALAERGIPCTPGPSSAPEAIRPLQRALYHALKGLESWQRMQTLAEEPPADRPALGRDAMAALVGHWRAWAESLAPDPAASGSIEASDSTLAETLSRYDTLAHTQSPQAAFEALLADAAHHALPPPVQALWTAAEAYQRVPDLAALCWAIVWQTPHAPVLETVEGATALAGFLRALAKGWPVQEGPEAPETRDPLRDVDMWFADAWPTGESPERAGDEGEEPAASAVHVVSPDHAVPDAVRLLTPFEAQGAEALWVMIPGLTQGVFPASVPDEPVLGEAGRARLAAAWPALSPQAASTCGIPAPPPWVLAPAPLQREALQGEEARLLALALTRARRQVTLSTHRNAPDPQGERAPVSPSPFWQSLGETYARLCGEANPLATTQHGSPEGWLKAPQADAVTGHPPVSERAPVARSRWAALPRQDDTPLFAPEESLSLSASGIQNYRTCPRQFFYQRLLGLHPPSAPQAALGSLIHDLMAQFNRQWPAQPYTAERLEAMARALFSSAMPEPTPEDAARGSAMGWSDTTRQTLARLTPVEQQDALSRVLASIADLARHGYFDTPPRRVLAEEGFVFALPGVPRCEIRGTIDALRQNPDGQWDLLDYKCGRSLYPQKGAANREKAFWSALQPKNPDPIADPADNPSGNTARDYQIPLYALAIAHSAALRQRLTPDGEAAPVLGQAGLQMIRPAHAQGNGSVAVTVPFEQLSPLLPGVVREIETDVALPILASTHLAVMPGAACESCAFAAICDADPADRLPAAFSEGDASDD